MIFSIDVFNSRAPVWMASDFWQKMSGEYVAEFRPVGGMFCFEGIVMADHLPKAASDYRPLLDRIHANSNARTGLAICGPEVSRFYPD